MSDVLGTLIVDIATNSAKFAEGIDRANKKADQFERNLKRTRDAALKLFAGFSAVAYVRSTLQAVDSTAKLADRIGASVSELQGMRFAAGQTGTEIAAFDKGIEEMRLRISKAADGAGELRKVLDGLGVDAEALNQLSLDQQFSVIADAMKNAATEGDRIAISAAAFGTQATSLTNLLKDGSGAVRELTREFNSFGVSMDQQGARNIESFNDELARTITVVDGIGQRIVADFIPIAEKLTSFFRDKVTPYIITFANSLNVARAGWHGIFATMTGDSDKIAAALADIDDATERLERGVLNVDRALQGLGGTVGAIAAIGPIEIGISSGQNNIERDLAAVKRLFEDTRTPAEEFAATMRELSELYQLGFFQQVGGDDTYLRAAIAAQEKFVEESRRQAGIFDQVWGDVISRFSAGIGDAVADFLIDGKNFSDSMRQLALTVLRQVISTMVQIGITRTIQNATAMAEQQAMTAQTIANQAAITAAATPAAVGVSLSTAGANSGPAVAGILAAIAAGAAIAAAARAEGGPVNRNQPYIVGERGMELFVPDSAGHIVSNEALSAGGGATVINFNVSAVDAGGFDRLLRKREGYFLSLIRRAYYGRGSVSPV